MEMDDFKNMDISIFERYAQVGKKSKSIETLIKYLRNEYKRNIQSNAFGL